jgi:hypothetical protein
MICRRINVRGQVGFSLLGAIGFQPWSTVLTDDVAIPQ